MGQNISTVVYVANCSPKQCLQVKTPEEIYIGYKPGLLHLKVFGWKALTDQPNLEGKWTIQPNNAEVRLLHRAKGLQIT